MRHPAHPAGAAHPARGGQASSRAASILGAALLALLIGCGDATPGGLRRHRDATLSFVYPDDWKLTRDGTDLEQPDARVVILEAAPDTVVMLHRFAPSSGWRIDEFAQEFARQRRQELVQNGASRPQDLERSELAWAARGRDVPGIRDDFVIERDGVVSQQTSLFFVLEEDGVQIFVSAHLPTPGVAALEPDLRAVLRSLQGGPPS